MNKRKNILGLTLVAAVTIIGLFFIYPISPFQDFALEKRPWRLGLDLIGGSHLVYKVDMKQVSPGARESVMAGLRDVIEGRVNLFGVAEPQVYAATEGGEYRLVVELAGVKDVSEAIEQIGMTPDLVFAEVDFSEEGVMESVVPTELSGRYVESAQVAYEQRTGEPIVLLEFTREGADLFESITEKNIGRPLAVVVDGDLKSAPIVQQKISGGKAQVTGMTLAEARTLTEQLNAGALPAPITLINQQTVSASLGEKSLELAVVAGIIGTLAVMVFMVLYYRRMGILAVIALFVYVVLTLLAFKILPVTMTLAGIAGFLLSVGMAVDANILIFERTKEEIRRGSSLEIAIENGFKRAWTSIRDSNVTTIITAVILYYFTASFVKGFALTLMIGVLISMFTAITVTRVMMSIKGGRQ